MEDKASFRNTKVPFALSSVLPSTRKGAGDLSLLVTVSDCSAAREPKGGSVAAPLRLRSWAWQLGLLPDELRGGCVPGGRLERQHPGAWGREGRRRAGEEGTGRKSKCTEEAWIGIRSFYFQDED